MTPEISGIYFIIPQTAACCTELRVWKIEMLEAIDNKVSLYYNKGQLKRQLEGHS